MTLAYYMHKVNLKSLETNLSYDFKRLSDKANRLSLNVKKTKLLTFRSKHDKSRLDKISIKIQGNKIKSSTSVKYLGVYIDENLSWNNHIKELYKKLSRSSEIISKLRHYVPINTLLSIYYSIFYSHLSYGCPVWSLTTKNNLRVDSKTSKIKCIRIIHFPSFNDHTNGLFIENKLLKLHDVIKLNQLLILCQFHNGSLPNDL